MLLLWTIVSSSDHSCDDGGLSVTDLSMIEPFETSRHQQQHHSTLSTDSTGNLRPEYICAVELETWKKNEEAKFRVWLKDQEAARMKTLNA